MIYDVFLFLGKDPVLPGDIDIHTVASILKMYLRELPEPVIPFENFGPLIATIERKEIIYCCFSISPHI